MLLGVNDKKAMIRLRRPFDEVTNLVIEDFLGLSTDVQAQNAFNAISLNTMFPHPNMLVRFENIASSKPNVSFKRARDIHDEIQRHMNRFCKGMRMCVAEDRLFQVNGKYNSEFRIGWENDAN